MPEHEYQSTQSNVTHQRAGWWQRVQYFFDVAMDALEYDWEVIKREADIFIGAFLFLIGLLDFHSGKYCDGNTADYLSCTRPVTYYYYTWLEMILIILGVTFILLWFMKRQRQ